MSDVRAGEWSGIENRKHKRALLKVPIECRSGQVVLEGWAENISIEGLLVRCAEPFPQDSEIDVAFPLPGAVEPIRAAARVAHVVPDAFMGLVLLRLPDDVRARIEQYVTSAPPAGKTK